MVALDTLVSITGSEIAVVKAASLYQFKVNPAFIVTTELITTGVSLTQYSKDESVTTGATGAAGTASTVTKTIEDSHPVTVFNTVTS